MYKIRKKYQGITLVETMMVAAISTVLMLAVASLMSDSQRGFNQIYAKANSDMAVDEYIIRRVFANAVRQSSTSDTATTIDINGQWIQFQYYSSDEVESLDRYAKFYLQDKEIVLERGVIDPLETLSLQVLSKNVESVKFIKIGSSAVMILVLDDGQQSRTITTSATMQNP